MKRFRFTAAETIGAAVLLLCLALPFAVRRCSSVGMHPGASALADSITRARIDSIQARIDSAQALDDSLRTVRMLRRHQKRAAHSKNTFTPSSRDRLSDPIPSPQ